MSAPRKIWVAPWMFETPHQNPVRRKNHDCDGDHTYHHDDVVRELAVTLERAEMMMRMRGYLEMANECAAALAKIAQEG